MFGGIQDEENKSQKPRFLFFKFEKWKRARVVNNRAPHAGAVASC